MIYKSYQSLQWRQLICTLQHVTIRREQAINKSIYKYTKYEIRFIDFFKNRFIFLWHHPKRCNSNTWTYSNVCLRRKCRAVLKLIPLFYFQFHNFCPKTCRTQFQLRYLNRKQGTYLDPFIIEKIACNTIVPQLGKE